MKRFLFGVAAVLAVVGCNKVEDVIVGPPTTQTNPIRNILNKQPFVQGYPNWFLWRGDKEHTTEGSWVSGIEGNEAYGIAQKYMADEVEPRFSVRNRVWAVNYAKAHPEKMVMLHLNGESRYVLFDEDGIYENEDERLGAEEQEKVFKAYFPGHWTYRAGSMLAEDITATDQTVITVSDGSLYSAARYSGFGGKCRDNIIIVPVDESGKRDWYNSEYCEVMAVNGNQLTVRRGTHLSEARTFTAGSTYVASLASDGKDDINIDADPVRWWYMNLSSECPRDNNGLNAAEVTANMVAGWFAIGGECEALSGINFDVAYFDVKNGHNHGYYDSNNDGVADGGWLNGRNVWREGASTFWKNLRRQVGEDFVITSDAWNKYDMQAFGEVNGPENEGLVQPGEYWRGFSRSVNIQSYYREFSPQPIKYGIVVSKFLAGTQPGHIGRFTFGSAFALGAYANGDAKQYIPARFQKPGCLGQLASPLQHVCKLETPLIDWGADEILANMTAYSANSPMDYSVSTQAATATKVSDGVRFSGNGSDASLTFSLNLNGLTLPAGDVTFFVEAESLANVDAVNGDPNVYRCMHVSFKDGNWETHPEVGSQGSWASGTYAYVLFGYIGLNHTSESVYYYRRENDLPTVVAGTDPTKKIHFMIQGGGDMKIKSIKMYNASDVIAREFDKGLIVVNPSCDPQTVDLHEVYPNLVPSSRKITIPGVDVHFMYKNEL